MKNTLKELNLLITPIEFVTSNKKMGQKAIKLELIEWLGKLNDIDENRIVSHTEVKKKYGL